MRRVLVIGAAILASASSFVFAMPASAITYPFCLAGGESDALQCEYATLGQCQAAASGGLGDCITNPAYISIVGWPDRRRHALDARHGWQEQLSQAACCRESQCEGIRRRPPYSRLRSHSGAARNFPRMVRCRR